MDKLITENQIKRLFKSYKSKQYTNYSDQELEDLEQFMIEKVKEVIDFD